MSKAGARSSAAVGACAAGAAAGTAGGGVRAADQLRTICSGAFINMPVAPFAANVGGLFSGTFNEQGEVASQAVADSLQNFINSYADFIAMF